MGQKIRPIKAVSNPIPANRIRREVLSYFGISEKELNARSRKKRIAFPRQTFAYLLWHYTNLPQREIAPIIGLERTGVTHSVRLISSMCLNYDDVKRQLIELETKIDQK